MKIKKRLILHLLEKYGSVPLGVAAKEMYGRDGELEQLKVVRILNAYRMRDKTFARIRVRNKHVVIL